MNALQTLSCAALLTIAVSGCASTPPAALQAPKKPAPAAWLMQPPPNSQQTLDRIISPSEISLPTASK
ncbi:lysis protein [Pseudomonas simiae]|uniref:Lysis protein n=1 Tax=Pseudomonas simiae TaxID=321846 RepID=U1TQF3_9PSED|nr:lysis protein [Pseudomonas simiae]